MNSVSATLRWVARPLPFRLLAILALGLASLMFETAPERYAIADQQLVENLDFVDGPRLWSGSSYGVRLTDNDPQSVILWRGKGQRRLPFILRQLPKPESAGFLHVEGDVRVAGVPPSHDGWAQASLHIEQFDRWRRRLGYWPYRVAALAGDSDWQHLSRTIPLVADAAHVRFVAFVGSAQGAMEIRRLSIRAATETDLSRAIKAVLQLGWLLLLVGCVLPLLRRSELRWSRAAVLALALTIGLGSLIPQPELGRAVSQAKRSAIDIEQDIARLLDNWTVAEPSEESDGAPPSEPGPTAEGGKSDPDAGEQPQDDAASEAAAASREGGEAKEKTVRQRPSEPAASRPVSRRTLFDPTRVGPLGAHFLGYAVLTALALLAYWSQPAHRVLLAVAAVGFVTECLQSLMVTRDSELIDLGANYAGILLGWGLAWLAFLVLRRRPRVISGNIP